MVLEVVLVPASVYRVVILHLQNDILVLRIVQTGHDMRTHKSIKYEYNLKIVWIISCPLVSGYKAR